MKLGDVAGKISLGLFDTIDLVDVSIHVDDVTALPTRRWRIEDCKGEMYLNDILEHGFVDETERDRFKDMLFQEVRISHIRDRAIVAVAIKYN